MKPLPKAYIHLGKANCVVNGDTERERLEHGFEVLISGANQERIRNQRRGHFWRKDERVRRSDLNSNSLHGRKNWQKAPQIKIKASDGTRFPVVQNPRLLEKDSPKDLYKTRPSEFETEKPSIVITEHLERAAIVKIKPTTLDLVTQFNELEGQSYARNEPKSGEEAFGVVYDVFYKDVPLESYETTLELASGCNTENLCPKIHPNALEPSGREEDPCLTIIALSCRELERNSVKDSTVDETTSSSSFQTFQGDDDTHDNGLLKVGSSSYEGAVEEIQEDLVTNTICQMHENDNLPVSADFYSILSNMDHEEDDSTNSRYSFQVLLTHQERIIRPLLAARRTSKPIACGVAQNTIVL